MNRNSWRRRKPTMSGSLSAIRVPTLPAADAVLNGHGTTKRTTSKRRCGSAESAGGRPLRQNSSTHLAALVVPKNHQANSASVSSSIKLGAAPFAGAKQTAKVSVKVRHGFTEASQTAVFPRFARHGFTEASQTAVSCARAQSLALYRLLAQGRQLRCLCLRFFSVS